MPPPLLSTMLAAGAHADQHVAVFFAQLLILILSGRLLGEWMQRRGQPSVMGQLLAGIVLGPSVFGAVWPAGQHWLFPTAASDRQMLSAVAELGVLLLLLLTGMETDLGLVKRVRRTAAITSAAGIVIPFALGYLLGELLPQSVLPDPQRRLITSLFLATALSISSVKIVAAVLREVDFLRRDLGQVILAAAILDDTIGWTILALIGGLAAQGRIVIGPVLLSVAGTAAFLLLSFTLGSRWIARLIRWTNDHFVIEVPVISAILVIALALALLTNAIGVHTVLGAFVGGIMIGQSPILTRHIEEQLRGLIVALFMPVFFGVAGLSIDLKVLADPHLLALAALVIAIASVGKLGGCYGGARLARLNHREALAVGFAMNARGSTEVILATIGLGMGVLNQRLFTIIVLMAVVTTLGMPPLLRWALARVPMRDEERARLEKAAAEQTHILPKMERVLVGLDRAQNGLLAAELAGAFLGARHLTATVLELLEGEPPGEDSPARRLVASARRAANLRQPPPAPVAGAAAAAPDALAAAEQAHTEVLPLEELIAILPPPAGGDRDHAEEEAILAEAKNGYDLLFLGLGPKATAGSDCFPGIVERLVQQFSGPAAMVIDCGAESANRPPPLQRILVPTTGADYSRFGAEIAVAVAKGTGATVMVLHVTTPPTDVELWRRRRDRSRPVPALVDEIVALGKREGVRVLTKTIRGPAKESTILQEAADGGHQLVVLGTKGETGDRLHFGQSVATLLEAAPCPLLVVKL